MRGAMGCARESREEETRGRWGGRAGACWQAIWGHSRCSRSEPQGRGIACQQAPAFRAGVGAALLMAASAVAAEVVIDFEQAEVGKRTAEWVEQGVTFKLAHAPTQTKAAGRVVFFEHQGTGRRGIVSAMAMEPIPVEMTFPRAVSAVTLEMWGSTACAARVEALDATGNIVDRAGLAAVPRRKAPGEPVPVFELTVRGKEIVRVRFSGPRAGEYLAADAVRFTPLQP